MGDLRFSRQSLHPEVGGSRIVRNVGILLQHYTASRPRRHPYPIHITPHTKSSRCTHIYRHTRPNRKSINMSWIVVILFFFLFLKQYLLRNESGVAETGRLGFNSRQRQWVFLFTTASRPALRSIQPLIQLVPGTLFPGVKRLGREDDHLFLCSAEVNDVW